MEIKPVGRRVLIRPVKEEKTKGGIYIPESAKEGRKEGEVLAVGTGKDGNPLPLKKGDRVIYGGYSSEEFEFNGQKYLVIQFKDIVAKIEV
ncbi:MAG: co-chaperone GroES [Candidatus Aenigmarchaeota archaeon]|nr:co-chaperone GroES [Candidatus Aenigmarchaeota archaeon]